MEAGHDVHEDFASPALAHGPDPQPYSRYTSSMLMPAVAILALAAAIAQANTAPPELPVLKARLGGCSADFIVKSADGTPVYLALVHVQVRYGTMGIKRMDLEVGTNSEGTARIEGLPDKARPMTYDVQKDDKKAVVNQDVAKSCQAKLEVTLK